MAWHGMARHGVNSGVWRGRFYSIMIVSVSSQINLLQPTPPFVLVVFVLLLSVSSIVPGLILSRYIPGLR